MGTIPVRNEIETDPSQGTNPEEIIRDLEAKIDQIQSQISRYKTLFAAGSVAVAVAGSALFIFFSIVDERVRGLSTAAEKIATQQENILGDIDEIVSGIETFNTKIFEARAELANVVSDARENLAARTETTIANAANQIEKTRDEILANQEFEEITTKSLSVIDAMGRQVVKIGSSNDGGQIAIYDPDNSLMTLRMGNGENRLGRIEMNYPKNSTLRDRALLLYAGDYGGALAMYNRTKRYRVASFGASKNQQGGAWLYDEDGDLGLQLSGDSDERLAVYKNNQEAARVGVNKWGAYFSTYTLDSGFTSTTIGNQFRSGNGGLWLYDTNGTLRSSIFADTKSPSFGLYSAENETLVRLEIGQFGNGTFYLYNRDAKIVAEIEASDSGGLFRARSPETQKAVGVFGTDVNDRTEVLELYTEQGLEHFAIQYWNGATSVRANRVDRGDKAESIFRFGVDKSGRQYYESGGVETILDAE